MTPCFRGEEVTIAMPLAQSVSLPTVSLPSSLLSFKLSRLLESSLQRRLLGVALGLGLVVSGMCATITYAADTSLSSYSSVSQVISQAMSQASATSADVAIASLSSTQSDVLLASGFPTDGVYLYGQSPKRDQLGRAYLVFEVSQNRVVGAFYMPNSSFDCFSGAIGNGQLALTITDSYDRSQHPFTLALAPTTTQVAGNNPGVAGLNLAGYHRLGTLSDNDQRILQTCKADYQK